MLGTGFAAMDCCAVVADELQAEFIYEPVEGAKAVAGTGVGSVRIHDNVGIVRRPDEKLHEEPARPAVVASRLVQAIWSFLSKAPMYLKRDAKLEYPEAEHSCKIV